MESRTPKGQAARIDELEARLRELETRRTRPVSAMLDRVVPSEARRHFRSAGREQLLGMRALVDHWIKRLGADDDGSRASGGREEIHIE